MDRRAFIATLSSTWLLACGRGLDHSLLAEQAAHRTVSDEEVNALIDRRIRELGDYVGVLLERPKILERDPGLAKALKQTLDQNPALLKMLEDWRIKGLERLKNSDLRANVKMFLLDLKLEQVLHEVSTCLDHFMGVFEILRDWGHGVDEAYVGLFHAVYGTEFNRVQILDHQSTRDRDNLRKIIGATGERLAFIYGTIDSPELLRRVQASGKPADSYRHFASHETIRLRESDFRVIGDALIANSYEPYVASNYDPSFLKRFDQFQPLNEFISQGAKDVLKLSQSS